MLCPHPFSWLEFLFPKVVKTVRGLASYLKLPTHMAFTSEQTVETIKAAHAALVSGKETTAAAIAAEKAAITRMDEALAIVEPLKESNSALQTLATGLQDQLASSQVRLSEWEAQDAAEDAALAPLVDFLAPSAPPSDPETPEDPETPPTGDGSQAPPAVPTVDGVDLTNPTEGNADLDENDSGTDGGDQDPALV